MSYSSYEKDKKLMESWRKYSKGEVLNEEQVQLNVVEEEQLDEVHPALLAIVPALKVLASFMVTIVPLIITNREEIQKAAKVITTNPKVHPKIQKFAEVCLKVLSPFDSWKNLFGLEMEDAKNPQKLITALTADIQDQGETGTPVGPDTRDDVPPGLE